MESYGDWRVAVNGVIFGGKCESDLTKVLEVT